MGRGIAVGGLGGVVGRGRLFVSWLRGMIGGSRLLVGRLRGMIGRLRGMVGRDGLLINRFRGVVGRFRCVIGKGRRNELCHMDGRMIGRLGCVILGFDAKDLLKGCPMFRLLIP